MRPSDPLELLGGAQTLLGVLATLNVLCIFIGNRQKIYKKIVLTSLANNNEGNDEYLADNNFLFAFLIVAIRGFQNKLSRIIDDIQKRINKFERSEIYLVGKKATTQGGLDSSTQQQALELLYETQKVLQTDKVNVASFSRVLYSICVSEIQVIAPFFCLLLTLIILLTDQVGYIYHADNKLLIYAVNLCTLISSSFWFCVWVTFIVTESNILDSSLVRSHFECKGTVTTILVCFIIFYLSIINIIPFLTQTTYICAAFNTYSLTLVFVCLGGLMIYKNPDLAYCSYGYAVKHLSIIISFVFCITVINIIHLNSNFAEVFDIMANKYYMRLFLCLFLTLNGVVLPFLCPYIKCKIEFHRTRNQARQKSQEVIETIKQQESKFKELAALIKEV